MKITEESINHNALRLIAEVSSTTWDYTGEEDGDSWRRQTLAYIDGICCFAEELKKVLKE